MAKDFSELLERIREHCQKQGWYGPDADGPYSIGHSFVRVVDPETGQEQWVDRRYGIEAAGFQHPVATEDDVRSTEKLLRFPLPPVLRELYTKVANGGFGPGYGIVGARGGHPSIGPRMYRTGWRLPQRAVASLRDSSGQYLECDRLPDSLMQLCHWGRGMFSELDLRTGYVYLTFAVELHEIADEGESPTGWGIQYQASSVVEWLELWLTGELEASLDDEDQLLAELESSEPDPKPEVSREDWEWYQQHFPPDAESF
jgi:hypothetical protein